MKCNRAAGACTFLVRFGMSVVLLLGAVPVVAQTTFDGGATHKQDLKYALQEASEVESVYKETHLNFENRNLKKGEAALKRRNGKSDRKINKFEGPGSMATRSNRMKRHKVKNRDKP